VRYEPEKALATLPQLLADRADRDRLFAFLERLFADERVKEFKPNAAQKAMLERIRKALEKSAPKLAAVKRTKGA
jgi:hypothetical protein